MQRCRNRPCRRARECADPHCEVEFVDRTVHTAATGKTYLIMHGDQFDVVVALYHDQGLAPLKTVDFDEAVNVTLGLPFIRTSPDHGVAYDAAAAGKVRVRLRDPLTRIADL